MAGLLFVYLEVPHDRLIDVHKSFGNLEVLKGINLHVKEGEKLVIIGPSGSGKDADPSDELP
jgi:ABC-type histidine transport system ATPase subunit